MSQVPPPPPMYGQPPQQPRSGMGCLGIGCAIVAVTGLLICCGCGGLAFFGIQGMQTGIKTALGENAVIKEHIGEVQEFEFDWQALMKAQAGQEPKILIKLKGTKGEGTVRIASDQQNSPQGKVDGVLILPDGTEIPLQPASDTPNEEMLENEGDSDTSDEEMPADDKPSEDVAPAETEVQPDAPAGEAESDSL